MFNCVKPSQCFPALVMEPFIPRTPITSQRTFLLKRKPCGKFFFTFLSYPNE